MRKRARRSYTAATMPAQDTLLLALNQGTASSRAILFDHDGTPVGSAQREFRQHFPQPGWGEHDAKRSGQIVGSPGNCRAARCT